MSLRQSLTLGSTLSTCWTCLFGSCWFYPSLIPQTNLHHRFWVLSFMDWMWQVAHLRKQSALLANTRGPGVGDKNTNQDLQEVNSLILQVFHSGWWEQELFPDAGWAPKIISSVPFRWFFFQARELFSPTHTQLSSVKIQENGCCTMVYRKNWMCVLSRYFPAPPRQYCAKRVPVVQQISTCPR